jgi:CRP-like cAMP-binding protein
MTKAHGPASPSIPSLKAIPFLASGAQGDAALTDRQRAELARIGTRVRVPARKVIYREESPADAVFVVADGVAKAYRELPSGRRMVGTFFFPRDLFGLAEKGRYVNSVQAITQMTLHRFPLGELTELLKHDGELQFHFLTKLAHQLRESQRHGVLTSRRDAPGRLAMFVSLMQERDESAARAGRVALPMTRSDIAAYLALSLETVSRAAAQLERRGLVRFEGRRFVRILDPPGLARLAGAL